jgi:hypothetical protein
VLEPIDLAQLRKHLTEQRDAPVTTIEGHLTANVVLALIDTAEAAIEFIDTITELDEWQNAHDEWQRLRETLNRYTSRVT